MFRRSFISSSLSFNCLLSATSINLFHHRHSINQNYNSSKLKHSDWGNLQQQQARRPAARNEDKNFVNNDNDDEDHSRIDPMEELHHQYLFQQQQQQELGRGDYENSMIQTTSTTHLINSDSTSSNLYSVFTSNNNETELLNSTSSSQFALSLRRNNLSIMTWFYLQQQFLCASDSNTARAVSEFKHLLQTPCRGLFKIISPASSSLPHLTVSSQLKRKAFFNNSSCNPDNREDEMLNFPLLSSSASSSSSSSSSSIIDENSNPLVVLLLNHTSTQVMNDVFTVQSQTSIEDDNADGREYFLRWLQQHVRSGAIQAIDISSLIVPAMINRYLSTIANDTNDKMINKRKIRIRDYCSFFRDDANYVTAISTPQTVFCDVLLDVMDQIREERDIDISFEIVVEHDTNRFSQREEILNETASRKRNQRNEYQTLLDSIPSSNKNVQIVSEEYLVKSAKPCDENTNRMNSTHDNSDVVVNLVFPPSSCDWVRSFDSSTGGGLSESHRDNNSSVTDASTLPVDLFAQRLQNGEADEFFKIQSSLLYNSIILSCSNVNASSTTTTIIYGVPTPNPLEGEAVVTSVLHRLRKEGLLKSVSSTGIWENDEHDVDDMTHNNNNSLSTWYVPVSLPSSLSPSPCFSQESYEQLVPKDETDEIRSFVASCSARNIPWSRHNEDSSQNIILNQEGVYFCAISVELNREVVVEGLRALQSSSANATPARKGLFKTKLDGSSLFPVRSRSFQNAQQLGQSIARIPVSMLAIFEIVNQKHVVSMPVVKRQLEQLAKQESDESCCSPLSLLVDASTEFNRGSWSWIGEEFLKLQKSRAESESQSSSVYFDLVIGKQSEQEAEADAAKRSLSSLVRAIEETTLRVEITMFEAERDEHQFKKDSNNEGGSVKEVPALKVQLPEDERVRLRDSLGYLIKSLHHNIEN